jgi:hypothetical protein
MSGRQRRHGFESSPPSGIYTLALGLFFAACGEDTPSYEVIRGPGTLVDGGVDSAVQQPPAYDAGSAPGPDAAVSLPDAGADGGDFASCTSVELQASVRSVPVDIVWIIDSSGSMGNERDAIQQNLNAFAAKFANAAIDVRVAVMTDGDEFEVPAPLGTDPARFLFVDRNVGSDDALSFFVERFDEYGDFLRPEAKLELIAVTDDESSLAAAEFVSSMRARAGKDFRLHAIASERIDDDACEGAADPGDEYYAAAALTSGLTFSICEADGAALFDELAAGLTEGAALPCAVDIPAPPAGLALDPNLINVVHAPADVQSRQVIPRVDDGGRCAERGWYYDNPTSPRVLTLCPTTCASLGAGNLRVAFGCQTAVVR